MDFDSFTVVLLRRPADAPDLPEAELDRIQAEHVAFMEAQRSAGALLVNGPFRDQVDVTLRGVCVYALDREDARAVALQDPAVRARRLEPIVLTWLCPPGLVRFGA